MAAALRAGGGAVPVPGCGRRGRGRGPAFGGPVGGGGGARDSWAGFAERERGRRGYAALFSRPGGCGRPGSSAPPGRAPGPTNTPNAGEKALCVSAAAMARWGLGRRGIGRRRGRGPRLTAPSPAPAGPAWRGPSPAPRSRLLVVVAASVLAAPAAGLGSAGGSAVAGGFGSAGRSAVRVGWGTVRCGCGRCGRCGRRGDLGPRGSRRRAGRAAALRGRSVAARWRRGRWRRPALVRSPAGGAVAVVVPPSAVLRAAAGRARFPGRDLQREREDGGAMQLFVRRPRRCRRPRSSAPASRGREANEELKRRRMQLFVRRPRRCRRPRSSAPASRGREANEELKRRPYAAVCSAPGAVADDPVARGIGRDRGCGGLPPFRGRLPVGS